jgi:hypothetical protein
MVTEYQMSTSIFERMKNFHDSGGLLQALDGLRSDPSPAQDGQPAAKSGDAEDIGASDRTWQQLLQTNDFWRYL